MGKILRINNISDDTSVEDLKTLFKEFGTIVGAKISKQEETGLSKGYGFVKLETSAAARSAISALNGRNLKGREIRVVAVSAASKTRKPGDGPRPARAS